MTNEQLVIRIKAGEDVADHMEQLYSQVRRFIHVMARKFHVEEELEDLEQEGYLALYDAIDGYDPDHGVKFLTYAEYWIRQRMQRYLQVNGSCMRLPVHCPVKGLDGGEDATVGELVADPADLEADVLDQVQHEQLCSVLWECVDSLEGRQPEVIRKRYQEGLTMAAIGADCGVTTETIRQMERKALRALRGGRNRKKLLPFMEIYGRALTGNGVGRFNRTWTSSTERVALWDIEREEEYQKHLEWLEEYRGKVR